MKVKIVKADDSKWYKHLVGKTRTTKRMLLMRSKGRVFNTYVLRNYRTLLRTVNCDDCEVISE